VLNVLTAKDVHIALKKRNGIKYLMDRFSFETKESLFQAIRKVAPLSADSFIKELKKKEKRSYKLAEPEKKAMLQESETNLPMDEKAEEEEIVENNEPSIIVQEEKVTMNLAELQKEEDDVSRMLQGLETAHKAEVDKRRVIFSSLTQAREELNRAKQIIAEQEKIVEESMEALDQSQSVMEGLNEETRVWREYLSQIRENIQNLKKVTIYVYENGKIDIENAELVAIPTETVNVELTKLICTSNAGDFTVNQLIALVKLRATLEVLKDEQDPQVVFDSQKLQEFYEDVYVK